MKLLAATFIIFYCSFLSAAQTTNSGLVVDLSKNSRPDTITKYFFGHDTLLIKDVPNSIPITNHSFKTPDFKLSWVTTRTSDMQNIVEGKLSNAGQKNILDTLHCHIFNRRATMFAQISKM